MSRPALVFVGFMGAGKTTAARAIGAALGRHVVDTDALIEERERTSIQAIFERDGEASFRAREEAVVLEALDRADDGEVLALGGGAVESPAIRDALARHAVVFMEVDPDAAWARASGTGRPLARDRGAFDARLAARTPLYEQVARAVFSAGTRPAAVGAAADALARLTPQTRMLWADAASGAYPVWFGEDVWPQGTFLLTDTTIGPLYAPRIAHRAALQLPPGEGQKSLAGAQAVWNAMVREGVTRADSLVALGGGVVGDLGGFCAATFQRGIPVIQVPTTLVAQVDSAYGGKTAIDLPEAKNYVGAYHQPAAVHVIASTLETLPAAELAAGYAEVVKTALIAGGRLWDAVLAGAVHEPDVVWACARLKLSVVAADERDGGARQVLNLGHTVGHAIEAVTGYTRYRHGEAVGLGMLAALTLSGQPELRETVRELLAARGLPVTLAPEVDSLAVLTATHSDKKRIGADVPFVLVGGPGDVTPGHVCARRDILGAVEDLR